MNTASALTEAIVSDFKANIINDRGYDSTHSTAESLERPEDKSVEFKAAQPSVPSLKTIQAPSSPLRWKVRGGRKCRGRQRLQVESTAGI